MLHQALNIEHTMLQYILGMNEKLINFKFSIRLSYNIVKCECISWNDSLLNLSFVRMKERIWTERGGENTFYSWLIIRRNIMNQNQQHLLCMNSICSKKCLLCLFLDIFTQKLKSTLTLDLDANMVVQYSTFDVCIEIVLCQIMLLNLWMKENDDLNFECLGLVFNFQ